MSIATFAHLIHEVQHALRELPLCESLNIEDLQIDLRGEDSNLSSWMRSMFGSIRNSTHVKATTNFTVSALASDSWLTDVIDLNDADQFPSQIYTRRYDTFNRIQISEKLTVDYFPQGGVAWITDRGTNQVGLIHSSRTAFPCLEIRLGLIDIVNRHLESQGWHTFHSGAAVVNDRVFMIVGDSGSGKTTLLSNMLNQKATYIANERLFVKQIDDGMTIRGFPQTVGIGLGTAMQIPSLTKFIDRPDRLMYYQKVFEPQRVYSTPPEQWAELPDKLKFLPVELANALGAPTPIASATVDGIIFPSLDPDNDTSISPLAFDEALEILSRNYFAAENDQLYPRWLPIDYDYNPNLNPAPIIAALSNLSAYRLKYFVTGSDASLLNSLVDKLSRPDID